MISPLGSLMACPFTGLGGTCYRLPAV
jgi:hypothetical protein